MPDVKGLCYPLGSSYLSMERSLGEYHLSHIFDHPCAIFDRTSVGLVCIHGSFHRAVVQGTPSLEFLFSSLTPKFGSYLEFSSTPVASGYPVHCTPWTRSPARTYSRLSPDKGTRAYCCLTCRDRTTHSRPVTSLCDRIRVSFHPAPPWVLY